MYPRYEESDSIITILTHVFKTLKKRINEANTSEDAFYSVRILHNILEFRSSFLNHISHGGSRTGFNFGSERLYYITADILFKEKDIEEIKKIVNEGPESLKNLIMDLEPFPTSVFEARKWKYHHPREESPQYFYSYTHADHISEKIIDVFKGMIPYQIKFWVDKDDLRRFHKLPEEISRAIDESQAAILMLSKNYMVSKWCNLEWQAAIERNLHGDPPLRLYVVLVDKCEIPSLLSPYFRTNLIGMPDPEAFLELLKLIQDILSYEMLAH